MLFSPTEKASVEDFLSPWRIVFLEHVPDRPLVLFILCLTFYENEIYMMFVAKMLQQ